MSGNGSVEVRSASWDAKAVQEKAKASIREGKDIEIVIVREAARCREEREVGAEKKEQSKTKPTGQAFSQSLMQSTKKGDVQTDELKRRAA